MGLPRAAWVLLAAACSEAHVEVGWEFTNGLEGWGNASDSELRATVSAQAGELLGAVLGAEPHVDSPRLSLAAKRQRSVVVRLRYLGGATVGRLTARSGGAIQAADAVDHGLAQWAPRPAAAVVRASSGLGTTAALAADGDPHTHWAAAVTSPSAGAWVVLDLGGAYDVTTLTVWPHADGAHGPAAVRLQHGHSADGVFSDVPNAAFAVADASQPQTFDGFSKLGRFYRVYFEATHGAADVWVRDIALKGPGDVFTSLDFDLVNDGQYHTYHLPLHTKLHGRLTQLRLGVTSREATPYAAATAPATLGNSVGIDFIRVVQAPIIEQVTGCLDGYSTLASLAAPTQANVDHVRTPVNEYLWKHETVFGALPVRYAATHNCLRDGGETLTVSGAYFGDADAVVEVGGRRCTGVAHVAGDAAGEGARVTCTVPPFADGVHFPNAPVAVTLASGTHPGLVDAKPYLSYQAAPAVPAKPVVSNVAARAVDLTWAPPGDWFAHLAVTGYEIAWQAFDGEGRALGPASRTTVGNVTTTTVHPLEARTVYEFTVAALAETQGDEEWTTIDLYGRRRAVDGALSSTPSVATDAVATLAFDFEFSGFSANATVNNSQAAGGPAETLGPTGAFGGEGGYGLTVLGEANVENCNSSVSCCDGYNATLGAASCAGALTCAVSNRAQSLLGAADRQVASNLDGGAKIVEPYVPGALRNAAPIAHACGPAVRLTASHARGAGGVYYSRRMNVEEGFDTVFEFEVSNPSTRCNLMDGEHSYCRSRGGDGLAFVIQAHDRLALGSKGMGLGYDGIPNSLAVEFDTFYNAELAEPYENHVAVHTRGWRAPNSANHSHAVASTTNVPDLARGRHAVRVRYTPNLDPEALFTDAFEASLKSASFFSNDAFVYGGLPDWSDGVGQLDVFVDDLERPVLTTPLALGSTLELDHGRAHVGFTAATGYATHQTHDVVRWEWTSSRRDPAVVAEGFDPNVFSRTVAVNGHGPHSEAKPGELQYPQTSAENLGERGVHREAAVAGSGAGGGPL